MILFLFTSPGVLYGQNELQCDSLRAYFDSLSSKTVGLVQYENAPEIIGGHEQLCVESNDSIGIGEIFVWLVIDKQGIARCARIIKSDNEMLNDQAIMLIRKLSFTPAKQHEKPVLCAMGLPVPFGEKRCSEAEGEDTRVKRP